MCVHPRLSAIAFRMCATDAHIFSDACRRFPFANLNFRMALESLAHLHVVGGAVVPDRRQGCIRRICPWLSTLLSVSCVYHDGPLQSRIARPLPAHHPTLIIPRMAWKEVYESRVTTAEEAARVVKSGDLVYVPAPPQPQVVLQALADRRDELQRREGLHRQPRLRPRLAATGLG